jgi:hypothetical protein
MTTTTTSRRAILAGAAMLPALSLPALTAAAPTVAALPDQSTVATGTGLPTRPVPVAAPAGTDPIIIAIAEHRRLSCEWDSLCNELTKAEDAVEERRPSTLIAWRNYTAIGYSGIERARDEFLAAGANRKKIEVEYQKAKARERAAYRIERQWYKRHGLAKLKAEVASADKAEGRAATGLGKIRPATVAGTGALIAYVRYTAREHEGEWHAAALANASRALLAMPDEAIPPFAEQASDLDLLNAAYQMRNSDSALDRLHKRHGDDADRRDDYRRIEAERDEALGILATRRSQSSNGMIAKAEALKSRLIEDYAWHRTVAASLAADVLRHFGAREAVQS